MRWAVVEKDMEQHPACVRAYPRVVRVLHIDRYIFKVWYLYLASRNSERIRRQAFEGTLHAVYWYLWRDRQQKDATRVEVETTIPKANAHLDCRGKQHHQCGQTAPRSCVHRHAFF